MTWSVIMAGVMAEGGTGWDALNSYHHHDDIIVFFFHDAMLDLRCSRLVCLCWLVCVCLCAWKIHEMTHTFSTSFSTNQLHDDSFYVAAFLLSIFFIGFTRRIFFIIPSHSLHIAHCTVGRCVVTFTVSGAFRFVLSCRCCCCVTTFAPCTRHSAPGTLAERLGERDMTFIYHFWESNGLVHNWCICVCGKHQRLCLWAAGWWWYRG